MRTVVGVQTFLPYEDFAMSAAVLDRARLGKQRVECLQVLKALVVPGYGWANHPAVRMWAGHEYALVDYSLAVCSEWTARGYADTCAGKIVALVGQGGSGAPWWLGDERLHLSHRSNLLRKDPLWYGPRFEPGLDPGLAYFWPGGSVCDG